MNAASRPLIRLSRQSYAALKAMSKETKKPMSKIAEDAIARYDDERYWDAVDKELESWTPEQWRKYREEYEGWDSMPGPSLPADDWSDQWRAQQQRSEAEARRSLVGGSRSGPRTRARRTKAGRRRVG